MAVQAAELARQQYAQKRQKGIAVFWRRLGGMPDIPGKDVLDVGCGLGALSFSLAKAGANRVVGVDINHKSIDYANKLLYKCSPSQQKVQEFIVADPRELDEKAKFDCIVTRDAFEHVIDLPELFADLVQRLRPGGRMYIGFGPLYRGPFGGHRRMHMAVPWGHLMMPEHLLLRWVNRYRAPEDQVSSVKEMGLNQLRLVDYRQILVEDSGLSAIYWRVNHGQRLISKIFALLYRLPVVGELFANDLYAVLEKQVEKV